MLVFLITALSFLFKVQSQLSCGISGNPSGLIVNGAQSQRGAWPWIVAIYNQSDNSFLCGGTLIGTKTVLTVKLFLLLFLMQILK